MKLCDLVEHGLEALEFADSERLGHHYVRMDGSQRESAMINDPVRPRIRSNRFRSTDLDLSRVSAPV